MMLLSKALNFINKFHSCTGKLEYLEVDGFKIKQFCQQNSNLLVPMCVCVCVFFFFLVFFKDYILPTISILNQHPWKF